MSYHYDYRLLLPDEYELARPLLGFIHDTQLRSAGGASYYAFVNER